MAGVRQWSNLIRDLEDRFWVRAVNLFGYGGTPAWSDAKPPSLDDFARLVAQVVPNAARDICLVGHSFGGAVAMQAAARQLRGRVNKLVLIEPSLFALLDRCDHQDAFGEISILADDTLRCISHGMPERAAERFIDYWCGHGTWTASSPDRRCTFARLIALLPHEWNAVLEGQTTPAKCIAELPQDSLVIASAGTARPAREIVEMLLHARPDWKFASVCEGGHMAPVTHPQVVNPIIRRFLA
jgi:pimeloyl-ACP methyl ester carboxylesterase